VGIEKYLNKITCGDCLEVMKKLPDKCVDLTVTSPPYNINLRIRGNDYCKRSKGESGPCNKYNNFSDDMPIDDYYDFQKSVISEMLRVSKLSFYIIQPVTGNKEALFRLIGEFSKDIKEIIVWDKKNAEPAIMSGVLNSEYEFIIVFDSENPRQRLFSQANFARGTLSNIFRFGKSTERIKGHKATFPIDMVKKIILNFSNENDTIIDPFLGSGTTAVACAQLKRNFIGIEISRDYCDIAEQRLKNLQPTLL
jgi:site-specific DNA-methyltransferase (adenine-specific)